MTVDLVGALFARLSVVTPPRAWWPARPPAPLANTTVSRPEGWARLARSRPRCWRLFFLFPQW